MTLTLDDIYDYLQEPHRYEHYIMACCEFHPDNSPSLRVSQYGYKCMACGAHGSLEKLYEKVSGRVVIREKVYNPSSFIWRNWAEKFGSIQNIAKIAHQALVNNPDDGHYLQQRGIDSQIKSCMIGYLDGYYCFPIKNEFGEIQGMVVRASPTIQTKRNRYSVSPDCPEKLYIPSWRMVQKAEELYVCFGTIDAITLNICGYAGITGISGQMLNAENLDRFRKVMWIVPDRGEERSALEIQSKLGWRGRCLFLDFPDGTKDINDLYKLDLTLVSKLIEQAKGRYQYE